jgi:hypothetical protein
MSLPAGLPILFKTQVGLLKTDPIQKYSCTIQLQLLFFNFEKGRRKNELIFNRRCKKGYPRSYKQSEDLS